MRYNSELVGKKQVQLQPCAEALQLLVFLRTFPQRCGHKTSRVCPPCCRSVFNHTSIFSSKGAIARVDLLLQDNTAHSGPLEWKSLRCAFQLKR